MMKTKKLLPLFFLMISLNLLAQEVEVYTGSRPGLLAGEKIFLDFLERDY